MSTLYGDLYRVSIKDFSSNPQKKKPVTTGGCGKVYFVIQKSTKKNCVAKQTNLSQNETLFKQEIEVLSSWHHPAIIEFIGFSVDKKKGNIYLREAEKGSLESCIKDRKVELQNGSYKNEFKPLWNDTQKLIIAYGVACAMEYIHSQNILHRDLKADNILIDNDLFPYVTDFGTSKLADDIKNSKTIKQTTAIIMPPEFLIDYEKFNRSKPIDVYSYAMVLYRLWTELQIFPNLSDLKVIGAITAGKRPEFPKGDYPNKNWQKLIEDCWAQNPENRPTFTDICNRLESPEFINADIDVELFEKYKQRCRIDPESVSKKDNATIYQQALQRGSITAMLSYGNLCEKESKYGSPEIFYEMAANCCHCLDTQGFFFPADYKVYKCEDCNIEICEGCAKTCHKGHRIVEDGTKNMFSCECGKNHFADKRGKKRCSIEFVGEMKYNDVPVCHQHFYKCLDCSNESDDKLICQACAENCHNGHHLEDCGVLAGYCSCGTQELDKGGKCKCCYFVKNEPGVCTAKKANYPLAQRWFQCVTCGLINSNDQGICKSCAEECHEGHILLDRGVRRYKCQCQTTNNCKLLK